jgi:hypothetical protein
MPAHGMKNLAKKAIGGWIKGLARNGIMPGGFRRKLGEFYERLPGRDAQ